MELAAAGVPQAVTSGKPLFLVGLCPQNQAVYRLKVKEAIIQFLSTSSLQFPILCLSLLPPEGHVQYHFCKSKNRLVGMIWNRKFALKRKRALAACISMSLQTEFFVLENQIKAKLSVILFYSGGVSPLRSTIACWMSGSGILPAPLHSSCPNSCPSKTGWPTVMATWLMFVCEDGISQAKQGQFPYFAKQKRLQAYIQCQMINLEVLHLINTNTGLLRWHSMKKKTLDGLF